MFVGAMGPPGGGRNPITPRFSRHFNYISFTELEDSSKFTIFSTIVASWLGSFANAETLVSYKITPPYNNTSVLSLSHTHTHTLSLSQIPQIVHSTTAMYNTITTELLPTPAKSHYTFNLRDLSKVFQGMLMMPINKMRVNIIIIVNNRKLYRGLSLLAS